MSHSKERAEKVCLNCKAELFGKYCHVCGQENIEPKESIWSLISHFFADITHFDGKFFSTGRYLVTRPGFLSKEYIRGRRASYLHPIRMYVFTSALFFLIFYSLFNVHNMNMNVDGEKGKRFKAKNLNELKKKALEGAETAEDSAAILDGIEKAGKIPFIPKGDSAGNNDSDDTNSFITKYNTVVQYDSAQHLLPDDKKDGWLKRSIKRKSLQVKTRYGNDEKEFFQDVLDKFLHTFPTILFVSLPLYALFLKLLYIRRPFYYVDHGIFLLHLYIFTFLILLALFGLYELKEATDWGWPIGLLQAALLIYGVIYTFRAMKNFYHQGSFKTFIKFLLLNLLAFISIMILFGLFFIIAVLRL